MSSLLAKALITLLGVAAIKALLEYLNIDVEALLADAKKALGLDETTASGTTGTVNA